MSSAPTRTIGIVAQVVEIALGHNPKGANGPQHAALSAVNLVDAVAVPHWPAHRSARQVEILGEDISRIALVIAVALTRTAAAAEIAVP